MGNSEHADYAVEYLYRVNFFSPSLAKNKNAIGAIIFAINADENMHGDLDAQGRAIFVEQRRWPLVPFSVATYGVSASGTLHAGEDFTLWTWFTPGAESPWRAVSREEYYRYLIANIEGNKSEKLAQFKEATEKTPYQQWLQEAPQRKKDRDEVLKAVAQFQSAAEVAKMRKTLEDVERDTGEELRSGARQTCAALRT